MINKYSATIALLGSLFVCSFVQAQIRDTTRVYDTVTDADTFYLFPTTKPCFMPWRYDWAPLPVMVQEYVATDTVTVYGVAVTFENIYGQIDSNDNLKALLMQRQLIQTPFLLVWLIQCPSIVHIRDSVGSAMKTIVTRRL